jgi:hypothetical protein
MSQIEPCYIAERDPLKVENCENPTLRNMVEWYLKWKLWVPSYQNRCPKLNLTLPCRTGPIQSQKLWKTKFTECGRVIPQMKAEGRQLPKPNFKIESVAPRPNQSLRNARNVRNAENSASRIMVEWYLKWKLKVSSFQNWSLKLNLTLPCRTGPIQSQKLQKPNFTEYGRVIPQMKAFGPQLPKLIFKIESEPSLPNGTLSKPKNCENPTLPNMVEWYLKLKLRIPDYQNLCLKLNLTYPRPDI